jgi:hypothetical protein
VRGVPRKVPGCGCPSLWCSARCSPPMKTAKRQYILGNGKLSCWRSRCGRDQRARRYRAAENERSRAVGACRPACSRRTATMTDRRLAPDTVHHLGASSCHAAIFTRPSLNGTGISALGAGYRADPSVLARPMRTAPRRPRHWRQHSIAAFGLAAIKLILMVSPKSRTTSASCVCRFPESFAMDCDRSKLNDTVFSAHDWLSYLRDQVVTYRKLVERANDPLVKTELLALASACEEIADNIESHLTDEEVGAPRGPLSRLS